MENVLIDTQNTDLTFKFYVTVNFGRILSLNKNIFISC